MKINSDISSNSNNSNNSNTVDGPARPLLHHRARVLHRVDYQHRLELSRRRKLESPSEVVNSFISGYNGYTYDECKAAIHEILARNYDNFNKSLNNWINQSETSSNNKIGIGFSKNIIVFTLADIAYKDIFLQWYNWTNTDSSYGIIVTMDHETCIYARSLNKPHICFEKTSLFRAVYEEHAKTFLIAIIKWLGMLVVLDNNFDVILSEMDVFWRQSPISELTRPGEYEKFDIQISQHCDYFPWLDIAVAETSHNVVNIGFIMARRGSDKAKALLRHLLLYIQTFPNYFSPPDKNWPIDQILFDTSLRYFNQYNEQFPPKYVFYNHSNYIVPDIAYRRLSPARYLHNSGDVIKLAHDTKTVHISWGIQKPSKRIYCAHNLGIYIENYTVPKEYEGQSCFKSTTVYNKPY